MNLEYLAHHGVLGQKWGYRRYQNEDGSLTDAGRRHYRKILNKLDRMAVDARGRYIDYDVKAKKAKKKGNEDKYKHYSNKAKEELKKQKEIESDQWKAIGQAVEDGKRVVGTKQYMPTSKMRTTYRATQFVAGVFALPIAALAITNDSNSGKYADYQGDTKWAVQGNKWKVIKSDNPGISIK